LEDSYLTAGIRAETGATEHFLTFDYLDKESGQVLFDFNQDSDTVHSLTNRGHHAMYTKQQEISDSFIGIGNITTLDHVNHYAYTCRLDAETHEWELLDAEQFDRFTALYCIQPYQDGYIAVGQRQEFYPFELSLHLIDAEGLFQGYHTYDFADEAEFLLPRDLKIHNDTIYVLVDFDDDIVGHNVDREFSGLLCISPDVELLWTRWLGDRDNYWVHGGGMVITDEDIIVSYTQPKYYDEDGQWQTNTAQSRPFFERYSFDGSLLQTRSMEDYMSPGNYRMTQTQQLGNGDILISGQNGAGGMVARFTPELEHIWDNRIDRYLPVLDPTSVDIHHTLPTSDGGYLCVGDYDYSPGGPIHPEGLYTGFALKLDSTGCWEEQCPSFSVGLGEQHFGPSTALRDLRMWPNPVQSGTSTPLGVLVPSNAMVDRVELVDMMGRISDLEFLISYSGSDNQELELRNQELPAGLYSIRVVTRAAEVFSGKVVVE
jgi:hypothetical protein